MKPGLTRAAWVGTVLILAGWLLAVFGFAASDLGGPLTTDPIRAGVRIFGFILMMTGATITVQATLGGPTLVIVFGAGLNLAHQAGVLANGLHGAAGAGIVLLGSLWASRRIRVLPN